MRASICLLIASLLQNLPVRAGGTSIANIETSGCMLRERARPTHATACWTALFRIQSTRRARMGMMDFVKDAGEKLFGRGAAQAAVKEVAAEPSSQAKVQAANGAAADAILEYINSQHLAATGLTVTYDGATSTASVFGVAPDQATREKIALCCGNVAGVAKVNDMMSVDRSEP